MGCEDSGSDLDVSVLAQNDSANVTVGESVDIDVTANDEIINAEEGMTLTVSLVGGSLQNPQYGSVEIVDGRVHYTPSSEIEGSFPLHDSFEYQVCVVGDDTLCDTAEVDVTLSEAEIPANNLPVAVADEVSIEEDSATTSIDVLANDSDADGDTLQISSVTIPNNGGTAVINGDKIDYTPAANFNGTETFSYTVNDTKDDGNTVTVTVTVTAVNDAPVAVEDTATVAEDAATTSIDVLANDTDIDGDTLQISSVTTTDNGGTAVINGDKIDYTPAANFNGTETFSYTVKDSTGDGNTVTVTVTVTAVNDLPTADAGEDKETDAGVAVDINGTGTDVEGISSYEWKEGDNTLATTASFEYNSSESGVHTLTLTVTDTDGATASDEMNVTVNAVEEESGYTGAAAPGDFARFSVNEGLSETTLSYELNGTVFGEVSGTIPLTPATEGDVFYFGDIGGGVTVKIALANNLGVAIVPTDAEGGVTMVVGLSVAAAVDESKIVDRNYTYAEISNEGGVEASLLNIKADHTYVSYYMDGSSDGGCWRTVGDHIVAKSDTADCSMVTDASADARVVIKPGISRAGIVVDNAGGRGFGIGLEQKMLVAEEITGTYEMFTQLNDGSSRLFQVSVGQDAEENFGYQSTEYECDANGCVLGANVVTGSIRINELCGGEEPIRMPGVICVDGTEMGFIDPEDGYFMMTGYSGISFGVKGTEEE